jgi:hypothetical protein
MVTRSNKSQENHGINHVANKRKDFWFASFLYDPHKKVDHRRLDGPGGDRRGGDMGPSSRDADLNSGLLSWVMAAARRAILRCAIPDDADADRG